MSAGKTGTSFRLSEEALDLMRDLGAHLGLSQASVIELALRELARRGVEPMAAQEARKREGKEPAPTAKKGRKRKGEG
jgi:hypothetical protein